ncbi:MAG: Mor transcription activator family protein [Methylococcaceae bacterium]|nr:Mor transcription activator family protein [Methylococcaceae bacterium]
MKKPTTKFAEVIGIEKARLLIAEYGGIRVFIPMSSHLNDSHHLVELLGAEAAVKLCNVYCGETIEVPRNAEALIEVRNSEIRQKRACGMTTRELALRFRMTERNVFKILAAHP